MDYLRQQLLNYKMYSRRKDLPFLIYGTCNPETNKEENTEAVLKAFSEKEF